jgi:hypothetical protein
VALDGAAVAQLFTLLRGLHTFANAWIDSGTALTEHMQPSPIIGAELALTDASLVVTPGAPVTVYIAPGVGENNAFTAIADIGGGNYSVLFRQGAAHVDPTGKVMRCDSADYGATWSAPVVFVDTAADDRDVRVASVGGVCTLYWVEYVDDSQLQLFSAPLGGGAPVNQFGYPLIPGTQKVTSLGSSVDDGAIVVSYGGPAGVSGWLATRVGGTDVYWTLPATLGAATYLIYEPSAVRIPSGDLVAVTRTGYPGSATGPVLLLRSSDDGVTWGSAQLFPASHGGEPLGIDAPFLMRLSTGTLLFVGRRRDATGIPLTLLYSTDGGGTWSEPIDLLNMGSADGGYCGAIEIDSTHILISYYCVSGTTISVLPVTIESA